MDLFLKSFELLCVTGPARLICDCSFVVLKFLVIPALVREAMLWVCVAFLHFILFLHARQLLFVWPSLLLF